MTPSEFRKYCYTRTSLLDLLTTAINQKTPQFRWGHGQHLTYSRVLSEMGITLVTKTRAKAMGHRLKNGVEPVGDAYFTAPISKHADLYILNVQTVKEENDE